jgi:hypothetical protein
MSGTNFRASTTTLCDGHGRIVGDLTPISSWSTVFETPVTGTIPYGPPSCSIAPSACASMQSQYAISGSSYDVAYSSWLAAGATGDSPDFDLEPVVCTAAGSAVMQDYCGACTIYGGTVQLLYFPQTMNVSRDMCATAPAASTVCPFGSLASISTDLFGRVWSPCAYVSTTTSTRPNSG